VTATDLEQFFNSVVKTIDHVPYTGKRMRILANKTSIC